MIQLHATKRLKLSADARQTLIQQVEKVLSKFNIQRRLKNYPNPREYRRKAEEQLLGEVQTALEGLGFKFRRLPIHSLDTEAVESSGHYRSVEYILDLVFRHDDLEVDLYF
jgi:hypothetical protein